MDPPLLSLSTLEARVARNGSNTRRMIDRWRAERYFLISFPSFNLTVPPPSFFTTFPDNVHRSKEKKSDTRIWKIYFFPSTLRYTQRAGISNPSKVFESFPLKKKKRRNNIIVTRKASRYRSEIANFRSMEQIEVRMECIRKEEKRERKVTRVARNFFRIDTARPRQVSNWI